MSAHKWASRSSVITHLNRRRSSQSLDVQEPHDAARDDGTVCGIVRLAPTIHGSILVTWTMYLDTQVDIALKCHNSAQSWPFESKLGCPRASGRCPRRWDRLWHRPSRTHATRLDIGHLDNVLGHTSWTSRSSVITQLNRGRSSQSLDSQEPQDGARDDGTIHLLKRIRRGEEGLDTLGGHRTGHIRTLQSISHISRSQRLTVTRFGPP